MKKIVSGVLCVTSALCGAPLEELSVVEEKERLGSGFQAVEYMPRPEVSFKKEKSSFLTVGLSFLFPGLGHVYLGDVSTGGALAGSNCMGMMMSKLPEASDRSVGGLTMQTTSFYGVYAAYRDVRAYNGGGWSYKMPSESLVDLIYAPFNYKVLRKREVWGGLLGALTLAVGVGYFGYGSVDGATPPVFALPVGVGEEAFFRGYLQPVFSEYLTPYGGIAVSSVAFGAAHIPNAMALPEGQRWRYYAFSLPLITGLGAYFGYMTDKNCSLKESVAVHAWYDFVLFSVAALAEESASTGPKQFALSVPF